MVRAVFGLSNAASVIAHVKPRTLASSLFSWAFTIAATLFFFAYLGACPCCTHETLSQHAHARSDSET